MSSSGQSLAGAYASELDDTVLVREAQKGNNKAFEELVRHYDRSVLGMALHLTASHQEAQDIYHDAFLRAYQHLPHFRFECSFYTWLYRIVTNVCLERLRKNQSQKLDVGVKVMPDGANEELVPQTTDLQEETRPDRIGKALSLLSSRERMVFELKHYQGLKLSTVATLLNTTEHTARSTLLRATQKLRVALGELD